MPEARYLWLSMGNTFKYCYTVSVCFASHRLLASTRPPVVGAFLCIAPFLYSSVFTHRYRFCSSAPSLFAIKLAPFTATTLGIAIASCDFDTTGAALAAAAAPAAAGAWDSAVDIVCLAAGKA